VDAVMADGSPGRYAVLAVMIVAILVVADAVGDHAVTTAGARTTAWLRRELLRHILALGPRRPARFTPGEVSGRVVGNCSEAGRVTPIAAWCTSSFVPSLGGLVALVLIDPLLAVVFIAAAPVLVVLFRVLLRQSSTAAGAYLRVQGVIGARLTDALGGARTIAAAGSQDREVKRVLAPLPDLARHGRQMWISQRNVAAAGTLGAPLIEVIVLAVAGMLVSWNRITVGELVAAGQYVLLAAGLPTPLAFLARFSRARAGAARVAEVIADHPTVERVDYPGLPSHPQHALAGKLFESGPDGTRYGAIVTITPRGGREAGQALVDRLRVGEVATSLGGAHTVVSHVASTTHRQLDDAALAAAGIAPAAVRFSIGLEDPDDLIKDIQQALS
jgi:ATP-binding cassette subfamily B protein